MLLRTAIVLLLSLLHGSTALAESLRLVTGDGYAPFTSKALPAGGMLSQVVRGALQQRQLTGSLDWHPWNRGYLKTLHGDYDATFPYVRSPQREALFLYSEPLFIAEQYVFSRAAEVIEIVDVPSMHGRRLCYPLGWQVPADVQQLLDDGQLSRHSPAGLNECARLLLLGRDDFFISDPRLGEAALRLTGVPAEQFHRSATAISRSTLHLIVPRSHPRGAAIIEQFNQGLAQLKANGDYSRLLQRYLQQGEPVTP
jgi:polar amino acid transport system substrate-binding protein